jgi:hypothetical protein
VTDPNNPYPPRDNRRSPGEVAAIAVLCALLGVFILGGLWTGIFLWYLSD